MVLCQPCFTALSHLRKPVDLERCKKMFRVHLLTAPNVTRLERVRAHIAFFEEKILNEKSKAEKVENYDERVAEGVAFSV
jgi:hypothetical protein